MEDAAYNRVNDYYQYLGTALGHFRKPEQTLAASNGQVEYSRCIWDHYLAKRFGRGMIRQTWEEAANVPPLAAIDNVLRNSGSSLRLAFTEWTTWNYYTGPRSDPDAYYPEGGFYPLVQHVSIDFTPPSRSFPGSLPSLASRYYQVNTQSDIFSLTVSNIDFDDARAGNPGGSFTYVVYLNTSKLDDGYQPTGGGIFVRIDVPQRSNWWLGGVSSSVAEGTVFPNPFRADGRGVVNISISAQADTTGILTILSSSMDLVWSRSVRSTYHLPPGREVFQWNGRDDNGDVVASGVYLFVLVYGGKTLTGKIALLRD